MSDPRLQSPFNGRLLDRARPARTFTGSAAARAARGASWAPLVAALCLLQAACATRSVEVGPGPQRATEARLQVLNRTGSDVRIEADGRSLGEVTAGGEQLFTALEPGIFDLRGFSLDGALAFRRDLLELEPGETFTWILRETEERAVAPVGEASPGRAEIVVENGTQWDVEVLLDGQVLGATSAGATGRFTGILPGSHRLEARAPGTSFPLEFPVLESGEVFTWRLRAPLAEQPARILPSTGTGRLRVENPHPEPVMVLVNDVVLGGVDARSVRIFDNMVAGRVQLSAENAGGFTRFAGPSARIDAGGVTTWRVGPGEPSVRAERAPAEAARVGTPIEEPPTEEPPFDEPLIDEPPIDEPSDRLPEPAADLPADEPFPPVDEPFPPEDEPFPPEGDPSAAGKVFIVENQTSADLEIFFDEMIAGTVGAGMTQRFTELPALRFTPSARSASRSREFRHPAVDLTERQSFTWIIAP